MLNASEMMELADVTKVYQQGSRTVHAVRGVLDLMTVVTQQRGEKVTIQRVIICDQDP